ncbi:CDP-alcohol phosphatidyltransferase family protein [Mediterraneibacter gnavus]|uniref:CDP-alcohol phosphatidyltransferase family protein n=1 Tax=Mediterraneibacter gnavus TaxID=33038 RepID=UPI00232AA50B|nr:CDP-alcohol phosphatidyltransferase family protein [Mediterraneibacter gnavus]MDB8710930.1 CDP-alcohol phosphatidyltransferase family protein [Mediterraneibacter gnavus]MDB8714206.1 CDP-alcohol phosphatidyltransferase family protein [Mediterraneibacter gnavus]
MIGFYDYTVVLTYISFTSSIIGIFCAVTGHPKWAVFCLALSGLCDMFDGKIARTKKNRTEDEKQFGIQIDSLCDVVCFGVFPIVLCYELGMRRIYSMAILVLYGLAGVIRLGYFNVMETKRQQETSENRKYYQGLPITSMSVVLPLLFVVSLILPGYHWFLYALHITVAVVAILFVADFKFRKPTNKELAVLVGIVGVAVLFILFYNGGWWEFCRARFFRHM